MCHYAKHHCIGCQVGADCVEWCFQKSMQHNMVRRMRDSGSTDPAQFMTLLPSSCDVMRTVDMPHNVTYLSWFVVFEWRCPEFPETY